MRRLTPAEAAAALATAAPIPAGKGQRRLARGTVDGWRPDGTPVSMPFTSVTLVVMVSMDCAGCRDLVGLVRDGIEGLDVVGAIRLPPGPLPDAALSGYLGDGGSWVLGDDAFDLLDAIAAPFFSVVSASCDVIVEGVALGAQHVRDHCERVLAGSPRPDTVRLTTEPT
jgi:hypothetical protein